MERFSAFFSLIRIKQWIKNLFLFIPAFFAGKIFQPDVLVSLCLGFIAYSLTASSIYILNDYRDIGADRLHPVKKHRPLASGAIGLPLAFVAMGLFLSAGLYLAFLLNVKFTLVLTLYLAINIAYSYGLKHVALLDIFIIALGFLLRVLAGGFVASVYVSEWLVIMVFLLALFLALAKRRDDIILFIDGGKQMRESVKNYNLEFLNACLTMISTIIMVAYIMYTLSNEVAARLNTQHLYVTAVFVVAGLMRYLQITMVEKKSGSPTDILYQDNFVRFTVLGWAIAFFVLLYLPTIL
jgi:4-hydroxybenzoate polyprenyltransferase